MALLLLLALAASVLRFAPFSSTHILTDDFQAGPGRSDAYTFLWGHWWVHHALTNGLSPFSCDWVLPPTGADLRFHSVAWVTAFLTWPLSSVASTVLLYNLSILGLIVSGAFVMYLSLRHTFEVRPAVATGFGALFGMCPYFVFKAHVHPNLVGSVFWGSAIALLLHAIVRKRAGWKMGSAFAIAFWLCFWNSLVECAMLALVTLVVVAAAIAVAGFRPGWSWFLPMLVGTPSLLFFRQGVEGLRVPLLPAPPASIWIQFPLLSVFSDGRPQGSLLEYAGTGVPWGLGVLAVWGLATEPDRRTRKLLIAILGVLVALTLDPLRLASQAVRSVPLGESMRVFARFYPFALFVGVIAAARAFDRVVPVRRFSAAAAFAILASLFAAVETVPARVHSERVVSLDLPAAVRAALDDSRWVLVFPSNVRSYPRRREAYQVELGMRFAHMGHLTRESPEARRIRAKTFPLFFSKSVGAGITPEQMRRELERMNVGYIILDRPELLGRFPFEAEILHRTDGEVLFRLPSTE